MEHVSNFIAHYGYWAVALGCLLEGETVLLLAGYAARRGLMDLPLVMAVGAAMGAASDIALFTLGRWRGAAVLARWPQLQGYRGRVNQLLARWGSLVVVGVRFMYGLRVAGPILLGTTNMPWRHFVLFNLLGAALWASLVAGAGWAFGHSAEALLHGVQHAEKWIVLALLVLGLGWLLWRFWRGRRARQAMAAEAAAVHGSK